MTTSFKKLAPLLAVLLVAAAVRFAPWQTIFAGGDVRLAADGDTYYHALRAERMARDWPHVPWFDPGMNYPYGAEVPWPPLLDALVASLARATGPITPEHVAGVAAVVPPVAGVLLVAVTALLGWALLGGGAWWDAALLVALLPSAVRQSFVGRPDHHVFEALLSSLLYLGYVLSLRRERLGWGRPVMLGALVCLAFWNWSGSALYVLLLAAHFAALHLAAPADDPLPERSGALLGRTFFAAAVLLFVSVGLWGPGGALQSARLTPITVLAPAICLLTAAAVAGVAAGRRRFASWGLPGRAALLLSPVAAGGLLLVALPSRLSGGVVHGLTALGASSPWYESIAEFWPLLFSGRQPWTLEVALAGVAFGLAPLAVPWAAVRMVRKWREEPERRGELCFLAVWGGATLCLALLRRRFEGYAAVPLALFAALAARDVGRAVAARFRGRSWAGGTARFATLLLVLLPGLPVIAFNAVAELPAGAADKHPLLRWLRDVPAPNGRPGVLAAWSHGHEIQWLARKPVVSTPFGTDIDRRSVEDEAAFFLSEDPKVGRELLARRRVGFLLLDNPVREVATMQRFVPGAPVYALEERSAAEGTRYAFHPQFFRLLGSRLYFFDGSSLPGSAPGLAEYRLLAESPTTIDVLGNRAQQFKLFGVVPGAVLRVRGARPGATVSADVPISTDVGRRFVWATEAVADAAGEALLRVPYASGPNGRVTAGRYRVSDGTRSKSTDVSEPDIAVGDTVAVTLGE